MNVRVELLVLIISASAAAGSCKTEEASQSEPAKPASDQKASTPRKSDKAPGQKTSAGLTAGVMKPYEDCRALLAADKVEGIADCARAMSDAAKEIAASAPEGASEPLALVADAADALAAAGTDDLTKVRRLYGDVSKQVVAMLSALPEAAKGYHVFECPMAQGYKRWVQADSNMANPYMGTKMLECGSEVHDHHKAMSGGHSMDKGHGGMNHGHARDGDHRDLH